MTERPPLRERKQQRAREAIVEAAFELFAERGFAEVTVADIADRADVGRTTFFRYFGDKQEVVFADEQQMLDQLVESHRALPGRDAPDLAEALAQIRLAVAAMCTEATRDARRYLLHERLLEENPELHDRGGRKLRRFTEAIGEILRARGASEQTAALAPELGLACYQAGHRLAGSDPEALAVAVDAAFELLESR
ncbi:TetR/AcrR family transcriptional regulator [Amycolatopsis nigrescens]|uniref:TetR/AcrR family transcriptional regulator n=1 Tax=Amycolatopsis nigrescens TaxID=381445 RepID=UPI000374F461|nr:TetR family transcriptional regulator [Amycolatopsis nigrescens]